MTTREEWAEVAKLVDELAGLAAGPGADILVSAARALHALADGAVLCTHGGRYDDYAFIPLDPQP